MPTASREHPGAAGTTPQPHPRSAGGPSSCGHLHLVGAADTTRRKTDTDEGERATATVALLGRVIGELSATLDADLAVQALARLVVPSMADWCVVTLVDDDAQAGSARGLRDAAAWHVDPAVRDLTRDYARTRLSALADDRVMRVLMEGGAPLSIATGATAAGAAMFRPGPTREAFRRLAPESTVLVPLPGRQGPIGVLTLANGADRGSFTPADLELANQVASRAGLALDNARLYRQQRRLAEGLQRSLLTPPPVVAGAEVAVRYLAAATTAQVGGDWYDALVQPGGASVLVIGDVIGHDIQAAAAMGQVRTILRTVAASCDDGPAEVLRRVDDVMDRLRVETTATAVVVRLEVGEPGGGVPGADVTGDATAGAGRTGPSRARLRCSIAGHLPPLVLGPTGSVTTLDPRSNDLLLGLVGEADRHEEEVALEDGAVVLLYTDGLVERRGESLDSGLDRLRAVLAGLAGAGLEELCDEVLARMVPERADDDVALLAVRPIARESSSRSPKIDDSRAIGPGGR